MILYNVTINVEKDVANDWLDWMREKHIPDVMNTGMFVGYKLLKLLDEEVHNTGITYCVQYFCESSEKLAFYQEHFASRLQKDHWQRYKNKFVAFRTRLEVLDETPIFPKNFRQIIEN